ncbi:hypothetical protein [Streptomyces violaceusniger]|uniref:Nitroreductase domain-containing protein n=1 Tax=Streptomyces violaceusniger TaxID=68280 RepID=A0A4D4L877_STRVO|nr:hypothetical protein SVIO_083940 [Streptomyces violaceusniger]
MFRLRADPRGALSHTDPELRALHIGCGAALMNLRVAVAHEGWEAATRLLPDPVAPMLLASVTPTSAMTHVQRVLRLGYGPGAGKTPRRPVHDVLDIEP